MNKRDLTVLSALRQNSRTSLTKMSKMTRVPVSTLYDKLKQYERNIIKKHTAIIDFAKLGYNTRATVLIKVERKQREKVQEYLEDCRNINTIYKINNGFDYLIELVFMHIKEMEDFMENLGAAFKILHQETYYVIDDVKKEDFMSNPKATLIAIPETKVLKTKILNSR